MTDRYAELLALPIPDDVRRKLKLEPGATYGDAVSYRIIMQVILKGDTMAAREIREAIEGKARQRVEISGPEGRPIQTRTTGPRPLKGWSQEQLEAIRAAADKLAREGGAGEPPAPGT